MINLQLAISLFSTAVFLTSCSNQQQQKAEKTLQNTATYYSLKIEAIEEVEPYTSADSVKRILTDLEQEIFDLKHTKYSNDSVGTAKFAADKYRCRQVEATRDSIILQLPYFDSSASQGYWTYAFMKDKDDIDYTAQAFFDKNMQLKVLRWYE